MIAFVEWYQERDRNNKHGDEGVQHGKGMHPQHLQ